MLWKPLLPAGMEEVRRTGHWRRGPWSKGHPLCAFLASRQTHRHVQYFFFFSSNLSAHGKLLTIVFRCLRVTKVSLSHISI